MENKIPMNDIIDEQIAAEKKAKQLERRKEKIKSQNSKRERSKRTHILIVRGSFIESLIEGSTDWSDEDFKTRMRRITNTNAFYEFLNERNKRISLENEEENREES